MSKVIFVLGVILTLVTSCKKDDQTVPTTTSSNSNGTKQLRAILFGTDTIFTLFYKNNKIDSLVNKTNGLFFNFLHENNSITWFRTVDGEIPENHKKYFTALLDTDGLTYSSSESAGENSTYLYENNQLYHSRFVLHSIFFRMCSNP